ncbi:MAG: EAL domain-containing protein [Pseudomonadota bacterium]
MIRPGQLSIRHLALIFFSALLLFTGLIAGFAAWQTHSVARSMALHNENAVRSELALAVQRLLDTTHRQASDLALWDETRQQLVQPEYYTHWREHRVYESGLLSDRQTRSGLYGLDGRLLAPDPHPRPMPGTLTPGPSPHDPLLWLANEAGRAVLYATHPVYEDDNRQTLLGHVMIRRDVVATLLAREPQLLARATDISLSVRPGERLAATELLDRLGFVVQPNPDQLRFQSILSQTLLALFALMLAAATLGFVVYNRLLVRPLDRLSEDIDAMQRGHFNPRLSSARPMRISELETIRRSLCDYQLQLRKLHGSLENQNREFHSQARQDVLTGCYNRRAYDEDWEAFRAEVKTAPQGVAYLLFDCDRFKAINDTYGHAKGDRVLTIIAGALTMALRANDRLYRLGGDEFATFLSRTTPVQARQIAQRCESLIEAASFSELGIKEPVGLSIGIAFCEADAIDRVDDLPKQADIAMYAAKQPGRSRIALYGEDTRGTAQTLVASRETHALFQALSEPGMIELHYQAIHSLPGHRIDYYEALARIRDDGELILPAAFLPLVNSRRLETAFDLAVLNQLDADLLSGLLPAGCGISINLSAQSLPHAEVVSQLMQLSRHGDRHPLMLEITETSLITQMNEVRTYLELLRTVGYRIAMDDFGTGYSPLRYLVDLPVDVVKLDISLVSKLAEGNRAAQVVADFARMMSDAGYALVAEGVETPQVLDAVERLGIAQVQGELLGLPRPLAELATPSAAQESVLARAPDRENDPDAVEEGNQEAEQPEQRQAK